jgi:fumarylacetoacetate (FAA) hydrolase family protein
VGRCKLHGGCTPNHVRAAENVLAERAVQAFGLPREVEPHQALIEELHRSAGWVAWLGEKVSAEGEDALTTTAFGEDAAFTVHSPYYELLAEERKQLTKVAQACIAAGVEERRVRVIEQGAAFAAQAIRATLAHLGLDLEAPEVKAAVTSALSVVPAA